MESWRVLGVTKESRRKAFLKTSEGLKRLITKISVTRNNEAFPVKYCKFSVKGA